MTNEKISRNGIQSIDNIYYIIVDNTSQEIQNAMREILLLESKNKTESLWGLFRLNQNTVFFFSIEELNKLSKLVFDKNYKNLKHIIDNTQFFFCDERKRISFNATLANGNCALAVAQKLQKNFEKVNMHIIEQTIKNGKGKI
jgi:hypothetical protein